LFSQSVANRDIWRFLGALFIIKTGSKHSVLADNENLLASKYRLYLPTEEELKLELQRERELIERQILESKDDGEN
jgi:hypothetical protein